MFAVTQTNAPTESSGGPPATRSRAPRVAGLLLSGLINRRGTRLARERAGGSGSDTFRPDLEGLRGVAILLVLLYHAGLTGTAGGFVGVDVFFVLSGFLITGLLVRERERDGRIDLRAFYARRARRILPAAAFFIVLTLVLATVILDPLRLSDVARDAVAAAVFAPNMRFALNAMDYFQSSAAPSPLLHYWSLGVEEQFYLLWPALLILATRLRRKRTSVVIALALIVIASYSAALYLTTAAPAWAFYSLPTRAFQLGLGGLIAVLPLAERIPTPHASLLGWIGLAAIVASVATVDPSAAYPGTAALLPTLGAGAVVLGGNRSWSAGLVLVRLPLRFLGRISFSLYLAHWPILVLPAAGLAIGEQLPLNVRVALAALSIAVAAASYRFVEQPFRSGFRVALPASRTLGGAGATIGAVVVLAAGLNAAAYSGMGASGAAAADTVDDSSSTARLDAAAGRIRSDPDFSTGLDGSVVRVGSGMSVGSISISSTGAGGPSSVSEGRTRRRATSPASPTAPVPTRPLPPGPVALPRNVAQPLPAGVRPSLGAARDDRELLVSDGCTLGDSGIVPPDCQFGNPKGAVVALVGDSHASQWFPALLQIAKERHWRLVTFTKLSCRFFDLPTISRNLKRRYTECEAWRRLVVNRLVDLHPRLTIVAAARGPDVVHPADDNPVRQGHAMARLLGPVPGKIAILVDTPESHFRVPECIAGHVDDVRACETPRSFAWGWRHLLLERTAARVLNASLVDLSTVICPRDPCPVVMSRMIVYRDDHHLTATFARAIAPSLAARLPDPLGRTAAPAAAPQQKAASRPASKRAPQVQPAAPDATRVIHEARVSAEAANVPAPVKRAFEPIVATHPTDRSRIAVAYQRFGSNGSCGLDPAVRVSRDGGKTWKAAAGRPWAGSGRSPNFHSAIAWGVGPTPNSARLYWADTTVPGCDFGLHRVSVAFSDDEGRTWSRLYVERRTPAWIGGFPDITVDRNPESPNYGVVYVTYNWLADPDRGPGLRVLASPDFGRTWRSVEVPAAPGPKGFTDAWRIGYRVRTAPDGSAYVSSYQADLETWDSDKIFSKGGAGNVGRIGFTVTRLRFDRSSGRFDRQPTVVAIALPRNVYTTGGATPPGTPGNVLGGPEWSTGLDVDPGSGRVFLAVAEYGPSSGSAPRGTVRVGRSGDHGKTWAWTTLPSLPRVHGRPQSSFKPNVVAAAGALFVGFHGITDVSSSGGSPTVGTYYAVSLDGGTTFGAPRAITPVRWNAWALQAATNGPGLRERADVTADGDVFYVYGDGRLASSGTGRNAGRSAVFGALVSLDERTGPGTGRARPSRMPPRL